jgi:hypothetical protein
MPTTQKSSAHGGVVLTRTSTNLSPDTGWTQSRNYFVRQDAVSVGSNIPDWKRRIRTGLSATTSLNGTEYLSDVYSAADIDVVLRNKVAPSSWTRQQARGAVGIGFLTAPAVSAVPQRVIDTALTRFISKAKATQRKMQGLVFIGEIREVLRFVRNPFQILYRGQFSHIESVLSHRWAALRGRRPTHRRLHEAASDAWLEYAFGVAPLLKDVEDGLIAFDALARKQPPSEVVYGKFTERSVAFTSRISAVTAYCPTYFTRSSETQSDAKFHGSVWLEPVSNLTHLHKFGISWSEVLPAAWELIPWSFLADYFTNIGDIIEAATFNKSTVRWIERGTAFAQTNHLLIESDPPSSPPAGYVYEPSSVSCAGETSMTARSVNRVDYTGQDLLPQFRFEIPGLGLKWLNLAALAGSHNTGRQRYYRI